jgi:hypothetical protein
MDQDKLNELKELLKTMDVPDKRIRRNLHKFSSLRWLTRNLRAKNNEHPRIAEAMTLVTTLLRECRREKIPID